MLDHPTAPLGPPKGPVFAQKGPFGRPGHPLGPELVRTATGWSNWVGCINIMCLGPLRELYCTPRQKGLSGQKQAPLGAPGVQ